MWPKHGRANQTWAVSGKQVKLRDHDLCFESPNASTEKGTQIVAWSVHGGVNQQWELVDVGNQSIKDHEWTGPGEQVGVQFTQLTHEDSDHKRFFDGPV
mmetsp:Transcript_33735/g.28466  ORF Transcript_33735/g.28466 Transcript_33735/m.28466 type:complete len:99 (-) Transcript_33735:370-666(-)